MGQLALLVALSGINGIERGHVIVLMSISL